MIPLFPNTILQRCEYVESEEFDEYNEPIIKYEVLNEYSADLQPLSEKDSVRVFGKILEDTYLVILSSKAVINDKDIIRFKDDPDTTYRIIGSVENWNHILLHQKIILQKQRNNSEIK